MGAPPGLFLLSLDLELGWGYRGARLDRSLTRRIQRARDAAPRLLELLQKFNVRATWATVSALALSGADELFAFDEVPTVRALERGGRAGLSEQVPRLPECYFFPEFVEHLSSLPDQEVGGHTLTHLSCDRATTERCAAFSAELDACQAIAARRGQRLASLVFPGNHYSGPFLQIARRAGFVCYRGDRFVSGSESPSLVRRCLGRGARLMDAYLGPPRASEVNLGPGLLNVPGDRFLRVEDGALLGRAHRGRIQKEIELVARSGGAYHLWFHPHNLADDASFAFDQLSAVLGTFAEQAVRGSLSSVTMAGAAAALLENQPAA